MLIHSERAVIFLAFWRRAPTHMGYTSANEVIELLELEPTPGKSGWFKLIYHDVPEHNNNDRDEIQHANSTTVLYLINKFSNKRWYRICTTTICSFLAGDPFEFVVSYGRKALKPQILGSDLAAGQHPLILIPNNCWRRISCLGEWSLTSFICSPGFEFEMLEVAPDGWEPGPD